MLPHPASGVGCRGIFNMLTVSTQKALQRVGDTVDSIIEGLSGEN